MRKLLFWGSTIILGLFITIAVYNEITLEQNCTGYLKRAADANTIETAKAELAKSIEYLEAEGDTTGYTSILWKTPDEDIAFWYHNLKSSYAELEALPDSSTQLERSNTLMKLRETLTDDSEHGTVITVPEGLNKYPNNGVFAFIYIFFGIIWTICVIAWYVNLRR